MTRVRIYPYKAGSRSASALADAIPRARVLRRERSTFAPRRGDLIINWGSSGRVPGFGTCRTLNGAGTEAASNKLSAFNVMRAAGVSVPDFWTNRDEIPDDAFPVVCRTVLSGHSGRGIVMAATRADLVAAPLYVRYKRKQDEYRVHVVDGAVVAVQRKARRRDVADDAVNWQVRNHANGFIFARDGVVAPDAVTAQSIMAVAALGLDFGGVDVIWNAREERAYVLECNTACGLEGQTVADYAEAFQRIARDG